MEDNERERSFVIPFIYILFCLCVTAGGVLLVIYVFFPTLSQPWHPVAALALIGATWLFWLLTYIYSCMKHCFRRDNRPITTARNASVSASTTQNGNPSVASSANSQMPLAYAA